MNPVAILDAWLTATWADRRKQVRHWCVRERLAPALADEILSLTYLRVRARLERSDFCMDKQRGGGYVEQYFQRACELNILQWQRNAAVRERRITTLADEVAEALLDESTEDGADEPYRPSARAQRVSDVAKQHLAPHLLEALEMVGDGIKMPDICKTLNIRPHALRKRLRQARQQMLQLLLDEAPGTDE